MIFFKNTDWFNENLRILKGSTTEFSDFLPTNYFDLIFIDGAHDYENVCNDIEVSINALKSGGILCGHDYHMGGVDVQKAVQEKIFKRSDIKEGGVFSKTSIWFAIL